MKNILLDYNLRIRLPIILFIVIGASVVTYFVSRAERDGIGYSPEQLIAFSHKLHAGTMAIDCQYCHVSVEYSAQASIPALSICMNCHTVARKNSPEVVKLTNYYNDSSSIQWKRVHRVPDYAYFNHSVHVNKGFQCSVCHGKVENMDVVEQVGEFTMSACLHCHRNAKNNFPELKKISDGPTHCNACHR